MMLSLLVLASGKYLWVSNVYMDVTLPSPDGEVAPFYVLVALAKMFKETIGCGWDQ
jgi:hypothetical protein